MQSACTHSLLSGVTRLQLKQLGCAMGGAAEAQGEGPSGRSGEVRRGADDGPAEADQHASRI